MKRRVWKILQTALILITAGMSVQAEPVVIKDIPDGSTNSQAYAGHFTLVNADTDQDIQTINNDDVITLPESMNLNIRFNPVGNPGSVKLAIGGGGSLRLENQAPFSLAGDASGDYYAWAGGGTGNYTLYAYPYSEAGGNGEQGTMAEVHFELVRTSSSDNCSASGTILREYWDNVSGNSVSSIPVNTPPTSTSQLSIFEGPTNVDTNYGDRIRGYICPPETGNYTFWIASNDNSELWLSTDDNPANRMRIAYVTGATNPREWTKFSTQKSAAINLTGGKRYYIEALHKQGAGTDHVSVGWQLPSGTLERPIAGSRLSPFTSDEGQSPNVTLTNPTDGQSFVAPADILIEADASDDKGVVKVEFYVRPEEQPLSKVGEDTTAPYSYLWEDVSIGVYNIMAVATDTDGNVTNTPEITITVGSEQCTASGTITRDYWANVSGAGVSSVPVNSPPTSTNELTIFEGPTNIGDRYATRIRGYICPPATGYYMFWIASNDDSELWFSFDDNPAGKFKIASVTGATNPRQWEKYASQQSGQLFLTYGHRYYIEALHKESIGTDHIAVGWRLPDGTLERPISGSRLSPFNASASTSSTARMADESAYSEIGIYPNPATSDALELTISGYEGIERTVETDVEIINMTGDVVFADRISCGGDCSAYLMKLNRQLVPGLYFVKLNANGTRMTKRLLVK